MRETGSDKSGVLTPPHCVCERAFSDCSDGIAVLDTSMHIIDVNRAFSALLEASPGCLRQRPLSDLLAPADLLDSCRKSCREGGAFRCGLRLRSGSGRRVELAAAPSFDETGKICGIVASARAVAPQPRADGPGGTDDPAAGLVLRAQDQERQRIARELHDGVSQLLSVATQKISTARSRCDDSSLADAEDVLALALREIRLLSQDLRPALLDELGLVLAIESACEAMTYPGVRRVVFESHSVPEQLPYHVESSAYRIVQEALHNAQRHAEATEVSVRLAMNGDHLQVEICDNGRGFDPTGPTPGSGLANIRSRTEELDGALDVESAPGCGTTITARLCCRTNASES